MDINLAKDIANLTLTLILTAATVLLAIYTWRLVDETRAVRKEQVRPNIAIYLEHAETDPTLLFIVVENNGHGTAYDVRFRITADIKDYRNRGGDQVGGIGLFKHGMKYCPPGFRKKYLLMETTSDVEEKMAEVIKFSVNYKDGFKKPIQENFQLAVSETANWSIITPSDSHAGRIAEGITAISRNMEKVLKKLDQENKDK
ncbi:MAG: hypothetical protein JWR50_1128 [Mucilaginibacter sp.]|nr:hypothetical protein [Mucilaginibacter sp.]